MNDHNPSYKRDSNALKKAYQDSKLKDELAVSYGKTKCLGTKERFSVKLDTIRT